MDAYSIEDYNHELTTKLTHTAKHTGLITLIRSQNNTVQNLHGTRSQYNK